MSRECKKCLLLESAEGDILKDIQEKITKLSPQEKCEQAEYEKRLELCKACDNLVSGVCMKCGCYVEFRAAFKNQKCPDVKDRKWKKCQ
ncbi:MAG: hypothetical protein IJ025_06275 [Clostridia bacterium]|nr:hypothetical protein [Clostridia bacterium]